ncbi:transposase [Streptomyces lunalinharesii]
MIVERLVPDGLWELFQRVASVAPLAAQVGGRRRYGDREVLAAIFFVATSGCTWRQTPEDFGPSRATVHRRFTEWSQARVWDELQLLVLAELDADGDLDWARSAIDSVNARATRKRPRQTRSVTIGAAVRRRSA